MQTLRAPKTKLNPITKQKSKNIHPPGNPMLDSASPGNSLSTGPVFVAKGPNILGFPASKNPSWINHNMRIPNKYFHPRQSEARFGFSGKISIYSSGFRGKGTKSDRVPGLNKNPNENTKEIPPPATIRGQIRLLREILYLFVRFSWQRDQICPPDCPLGSVDVAAAVISQPAKRTNRLHDL